MFSLWRTLSEWSFGNSLYVHLGLILFSGFIVFPSWCITMFHVPSLSLPLPAAHLCLSWTMQFIQHSIFQTTTNYTLSNVNLPFSSSMDILFKIVKNSVKSFVCVCFTYLHISIHFTHLYISPNVLSFIQTFPSVLIKKVSLCPRYLSWFSSVMFLFFWCVSFSLFTFFLPVIILVKHVDKIQVLRWWKHHHFFSWGLSLILICQFSLPSSETKSKKKNLVFQGNSLS